MDKEAKYLSTVVTCHKFGFFTATCIQRENKTPQSPRKSKTVAN